MHPQSAFDQQISGCHRTVERVNPIEFGEWDSRLAEHPHATVFHTAAWARVLAETYRLKPCFFLLRDDSGAFQGLLPCMSSGSRWRGYRCVSLPFTDACPPLLPDEDQTATPSTLGCLRTIPEEPCGSLDRLASNQPLLAAALRHAESIGARYLELRDSAVWTRPFLPSVSFHGHEVPLFSDEESQLARCSPAMRRGLRKGIRSHLSLKEGREWTDMEAYYALHCQTRRRHGIPPQPLEFFRNIHRAIVSKGNGFVVLASVGGSTIAGAVFLTFGKHALYKFGASVETHLHLRPNNAVLWHGIRTCAQAGFSHLDLGRTSLDNEGLRRFKLALGGEERLIHCVRHDVRLGHIVATPDRAHGWHNRIFRLLPLTVNRALGEVLYRLEA